MLSVVGGAAGNGVKGNSRINMIYVFNRNGCIFYREWYRPNPPNTDDHKLMFGLVFSLRSFTAKMDPINGASGDGCSFHAFRTNTYKLNYLETPSGIKIILVTDPKMGDLRDALKHIYTNIYVEYVIKNPLYVPGEPFRCELFIKTIEHAKKHRAEPVVLSVLRENLGNAHNSVTLFPARGAMSHDRLVYSGDLSAEDFRAVKQIRPLLRLEYLRGQNAANIRHGLTGEVLMMVVTELSDGEWNQRPGLSFRCGPETEARVYSNGLPVGINISSNYLAISPPPVQQDGSTLDLGPSMVELVKTWENRALVLSHREPGGYPGAKVAAFTKVGGHRNKRSPSEAAMGSEPAMDLFRSEEMQLMQLIIPAEAAHDTISYLGELGLVQFKDMNPDKSPFQRTYANQVKRCDEMSRKLRYLKEQSLKAGILPTQPRTLDKDLDLDDLELKLNDLEAELLEINGNAEKLLKTRNELTELKLVLEKAGSFFASAQMGAADYQREIVRVTSIRESTSMDSPLLLDQEMASDSSKRLGFVTGLVPLSKVLTFERLLFRATRGNMFLKQEVVDEPVLDPATGEEVEKVVFVVFFSGDRARTKIMRICEAFGANRYPFPEEPARQRQMLAEVRGRLGELQTAIDAGNRHRDNVLNSISVYIDRWTLLVRNEKAVYHVLNQLSIDVTRKCLVAEAWCPTSALVKVQEALERGMAASNAAVSTIFHTLRARESPPTFFRTNKFTSAFQAIVDAYGVARYQEANPGLFSIMTFPFLFAIMFGDWGHGALMLLAALWLVLNEKKLASQKLDDITEMAFGGRYVILLMSIFSIYTGFIYNEFFSLAFDFPLFGGTAYHCRTPDCHDSGTAGLVKDGATYLFGVDPAWKGSRTELPFLNSLKMKMSIILGVTQMFAGIILSFYNAQFFKKPLNIWYEFIPQMLFLGSLFGYLSLLIILKWITGSQADLYHVMIYMFLNPVEPLGDNELFYGQGTVQIVLLFIALVSVPWMLLPKPLILRAQHIQKMAGRTYHALPGSEGEAGASGEEGEGEEEEEFEFGEVMVHQMIHCIEFVLGAVSNTASYLRLWALSLAHAQLSAVFYERVLEPALASGNVIAILIGSLVFAAATVGVLLLMETLSAFLHALRLHWVEFMNKFYVGDGYQFVPFSFAALPDEED
ncbi:unnamed protein product [Closterium sp. Yama58-4]|nr:unnamed protein product [Closterium sp. Yama58-4]